MTHLRTKIRRSGFAAAGFAVATATALLLGVTWAPLAGAATEKSVERAAEPTARQNVVIPFANHGSIRNWKADGRDALLIQGTGNRWYRAELMGPCFDLPFAHTIGFVTGPNGHFDRFSSVVVRGQRCAVRSLTLANDAAEDARS